jgi:hypothetical protein
MWKLRLSYSDEEHLDMLMRVEKRSWLKRTGQLGRFWTSMVLILIAAVLLLLRVIGLATVEWWPNLIMVVGLLGFVILMFLIKCPVCRKRPMLRIMKQTRLSALSQTMLTFEFCPYCRHDGAKDDEGGNTLPKASPGDMLRR